MAITKDSENLYSSMRFVGDGVTKRVPLTFDLREGDGLAVDFGEGLVTSGYLIDYDVTPVVVLFDDPLPNGMTITIRRLTKIDAVKHIFQWTGNAQGGADFSAKNVDENFEQITRASQDAMDSQILASETLEEMAGIRDDALEAKESAKASAVIAKDSESKAKLSEVNAKDSEELAKKWADKAEEIASFDPTEYRKKNDLLFKGMLQVQATDGVGTGVFLLDKEGSPRGQMTYNSGGLQFAQRIPKGTYQTYTLPLEGGELLTDGRITGEWGEADASRVFSSSTVRENNAHYYIRKQIANVGNYLLKLASNDVLEINCVGTSITEGFDIYSDDKRPPINSTQTVAGVTYPEALQSSLREMYRNDGIVVHNFGWSGDWCERGYNRWGNLPHADLTILEYGANDANPTNSIPISDFLHFLELFIRRELDKGSAVVLMQPSKTKTASSVERDAYANAINTLAEAYCLPLLDTEICLKNYPEDVYSDTVHLNTKGYSVLGEKVSAFISNTNLVNRRIVGHGSKLLSRPTIDSIVYGKGSRKATTSSHTTPSETTADAGIVALMSNDSELYYTVYASTDGLLGLPNILLSSGGVLEIVVDSPLTSPEDSIAYVMGSRSIVKGVNVQTYTNNSGSSELLSSRSPKIYIPLVTEGWHKIKIKVSEAVGNSFLYGVDFKVDSVVNGYASYSVSAGASSFYIPFDAVLRETGVIAGFHQWEVPLLEFILTNPSSQVVKCYVEIRADSSVGIVGKQYEEVIGLDKPLKLFDEVVLDGGVIHVKFKGDLNIRGKLTVRVI